MTTPKEALELKPCPFCGGSDVEAVDSLDFVACQNCGASLEDSEPSARELWNTRATASLQGEDAVERVALAFHPGEQAPDVKRGSMECCIVVTENEQGKHFAFPGYYLNAYPLQYDECRCDEPCEDGCPTTGWFYDESNFEYENCYYPISSKILRWALIPDAECILAGLVPDEAAIRADEREKCEHRVEEIDCLYVNGERHPFGGIPADPETSIRREAIKECLAAIRSGGGE